MGTKNLTNIKKAEFKDLTTFRVGGSIDHYIEVSNEKEISDAVDYAKVNNLEIFILGEGSDILVNDTDFNGLVIKYIGKKIEIKDDLVTAEAGANWDELVNLSIQNNLQGIECLSGIPGTVGASPIQNIGAYGQELKDVFVALTAYDIEQKKLSEFSKEESEFMYRESFFKKGKNWQKYIITKVTLKLNKGANPQVRYDSLKNYLVEKNITNPTLKE